MSIDLGSMTFGVREGVIVLIALVSIYMAVMLFRMRRLHSSKVAARQAPVNVSPDVVPLPEADPEPAPVTFGIETESVNTAWEDAATEQREAVMQQALEQEVSQLREELDAIRGELAALREDMLQEMAHMRAAQAVSPIYGDAMQMAAAGYEPAMIAERCGIARAEAELVVALAKSQER